jgi:hypothetical protein
MYFPDIKLTHLKAPPNPPGCSRFGLQLPREHAQVHPCPGTPSSVTIYYLLLLQLKQILII